MKGSHALIALTLAGAISAHANAASSGLGAPVTLDSSGQLTITLLGNEGLFSHILELNNSAGDISNPIFIGVGPDSYYDLSYPINLVGDSVNLGTYTSGTELIFRLTNYDGDSDNGGSIVSQLFSGDGALNPSQNGYAAGLPYASVTYISATEIQVGFEDLFQDRETHNNLVFDLKVEPVPIPAAAWLFGSGVFGLIGFARRRG